MNKHGDAAKPIWVSAFGWLTGGYGIRYSPLRATPRQQAAKLTSAYGLLSRNAVSLDIPSALWFHVHRQRAQGPRLFHRSGWPSSH